MIALRGGYLADPLQGWEGPADIYLAGGTVAAVRPAGTPPPPGAWEERDCAGLLVLPGPVDTCCRLGLPRDPWAEDPVTLARAAAAGGWTGVVVETGTADPEVVARLRESDLPVRLYPVAAATVDGRLSDMGLLAQAGAVAVGGEPEELADAGRMRRVLEYAAGAGLPVLRRPEEPALARGGVMHEGVRSFALGLRGIPAAAEAVAVCRDLVLARAFGGRVHFAALSSAESLARLGEGAPGAPVSAGVAAPHLVLTDADVQPWDASTKLAPPLRGEEDRRALREAVRRGRLVLGSGHRACPPERKQCEYDYAEFGASGLETALPVALELFAPAEVARAVAAGPARLLGLPGGTLAPGAPADVAVFDPAAEWTVEPEALCSAGRSTPLAGRRLRGRAVLTVVGGRVAFEARRDCISMHRAVE